MTHVFFDAGTPRTSDIIALLGAGWITVCTAVGAPAQTLTFEHIGSMPGPADMIRAQDGYVYVAAGQTLTIFDLSNPAVPQRAGTYTFPEEIWSFRMVGSLAYVGVNFFGLAILDVSDPAAPTLRSTFKTPGQAKTADVSGAKAVVVDHMEGILLLDVSNPVDPVSLDSFFLDGYARDVVTSGSMAYAIDSPTGFYVFDLSTPDPLKPVSMLFSGDALRNIEVSGEATEQGSRRVYLVGGESLQVYDVSNPAAPFHMTTYRTPGGVQGVSVRDPLAYVAAGSDGLQVVDFSRPSAPNIVGTYQMASPARDVAVTDSLVLVVLGDRDRQARARGNAGQQVLILRQSP